MTYYTGNGLHLHEFHQRHLDPSRHEEDDQIYGSTVIELLDTMSGIPLVLACSIQIQPGGNLEVPLECTRKLTNQMDIRIDTGFHHTNPNVYIPPSCINNPNNQYNPKYMPLTIFNLSKVDHLYIGRDTMIAFAEEPTVDTYNIELASEDKIKEHLAKPHNWVPQMHKTLPEILHDTAFICSPADVPGPQKVQLQDKTITTDIKQKFESYVKNMERLSPRTMRTSAEQSLSKWTLTQETAHL